MMLMQLTPQEFILPGRGAENRILTLNSLFEKIRDLELEDPETGRFFCEMRRSRRCRHLRLSVYPDGRVVLTLPLHESEKKALAFLEEHRKWIQKKRLVLRSRSHAGSAEGENGEFYIHVWIF